MQASDEFSIGFDQTQRRFEILERQNERHRAAAVGRAENDVEIRAFAFGQLLYAQA